MHTDPGQLREVCRNLRYKCLTGLFHARVVKSFCRRIAHCSLLVVGVTIRYTTLPRGLAYTPILRSFITMALDPVLV